MGKRIPPTGSPATASPSSRWASPAKRRRHGRNVSLKPSMRWKRPCSGNSAREKPHVSDNTRGKRRTPRNWNSPPLGHGRSPSSSVPHESSPRPRRNHSSVSSTWNVSSRIASLKTRSKNCSRSSTSPAWKTCASPTTAMPSFP